LLAGKTPGAPRDLIPVGPGDLAVKGGSSHFNYEPAKGQKLARIVRTKGGELPQTFVRA
jgi:hypothetical protein